MRRSHCGTFKAPELLCIRLVVCGEDPVGAGKPTITLQLSRRTKTQDLSFDKEKGFCHVDISTGPECGFAIISSPDSATRGN